MNRLGSATSPYLLQHAGNPVDWWPWTEEAFAEARRRDVPVLISVGYAACHWCHVMAHESFEDHEVATAVNDTMVAIKVDREERPDVDAVYMAATQVMNRGHGGWPMTVFASPDGRPFLCGTYYARDSFLRLVEAVAQAWREQRELVLAQADSVVETVARMQISGTRGASVASVLTADLTAAGSPSAEVLFAEVLDQAVASLSRDYDSVFGGFGQAPKFPPHLVLFFLLRHHQNTGDSQALEMVRHTCEAMARGGLYDQVAGGFARYCVDERWLIPHFEKMLYDNALLLRVYTLLWRLTSDTMAGRVAIETATFLIEEMHQPGGGFISSLDADTSGVEGATYVWTPAQVRDALGEDDGRWAADLFGVTDSGTFEHGTSVLRLNRDVDAADEPVRQRWHRIRRELRQARRQRPQPGRDEKVVAAWNGLAVTALCEFASTVEAMVPADGGPRDGERHDGGPYGSDPHTVAAAARSAATTAATLLSTVHVVDGRLRRVSRDGVVGQPVGVLEDYACVAEAFTAVHQCTGDGAWLREAGQLLDTAIARFSDSRGGFFDTADDAEQLIVRPVDPSDNATPSGLTATAGALLTYSALSGEPVYRQAALDALAGLAGTMGRHPRSSGYACAVAEAARGGPYEIAIVAPGDEAAGGRTGGGRTVGDAVAELARTAWRLAPAGAVIVAGYPDQPGVPLLARRPALEGQPTAYICRGFVCDRPVTTLDGLVAALTLARPSR